MRLGGWLGLDPAGALCSRSCRCGNEQSDDRTQSESTEHRILSFPVLSRSSDESPQVGRCPTESRITAPMPKTPRDRSPGVSPVPQTRTGSIIGQRVLAVNEKDRK